MPTANAETAKLLLLENVNDSAVELLRISGFSDIERLRLYLTEKCRGKLAFRLEAASRLVAGRGGKRAFVDQRLDVTRY